MSDANIGVQCGHCGNETTWQICEHITDKRYPMDTHEVSINTVYSLLMCSTCSQPTLIETTRFYSEVDAEWLKVIPQILYPLVATHLSNLPKNVERRYQKALKVKNIEPDAFAVMVGKTLEAACNHEKAPGKSLAEKLTYLANAGRIPQTLAEMAQQLRQLRNLGAHDNEEDEVQEEDVPIILDFLEAILEYLYVAPAKVAAVQARLTKTPIAAPQAP